MESDRKITLFTTKALLYLYVICLYTFIVNIEAKVHHFEQSPVNGYAKISKSVLTSKRLKRSSDDGFTTVSERNDPKCFSQQDKFKSIVNGLKDGKRLEETHVFANETKYNLALAWAGENDAGILLVLTSELDFTNAASTLWRSTDHGRTWTNWNSKVDNKVFQQADGLQRNPHNPSKCYLISYEHFLYVTETGGETWKRSDIISPTFGSVGSINEQLTFHPEESYQDYVAVVTTTRQLFVTYNNFQTPALVVKDKVHAVKWGSKATSTEKNIYVTTGEFQHPLFSVVPDMNNLECYDSKTGQWTTILKRVVIFDVQDKFMYASIYKSEQPSSEDDDKLLMISSDGGKSWDEAQLPTLTGDRFFSVLDMSEGMIFMHVDNPGDTGHGVLYTSAADGIVYSESLRNHLFPNYNTVHDFYKIESIRGVYLASQMHEGDKSIHTVITYNRGGEWKNVSRPTGVDCKNSEKEGCYLQIQNAYSLHRGLNGRLPTSQPDAYGIVLVHGHVASNLQTTPPDVYLSTNGGYNFKRVLQGPHAYEIADSGGLLVAVPLDTQYPDTIKFSTDEGNCWHVYKFTNDTIRFTGLLTEPGGKSMTVGIWGYTLKDKKWTVNIIDFSNVVTEECKEDDYEDWTPHTALKSSSGLDGCLLGQRETFKKIKADSWCRNGYGRNRDVLQSICPCSEEDYECDFGFHRPEGSTKCVRQEEVKTEEIDICIKGHVDKLDTIGYRLIPGDKCDREKGFHPVSSFESLDHVCKPGNKAPIVHDMKAPVENTGSLKLVVISIIVAVLVLVSVVGAVFAYKMLLLRRHKVVYRYSMLNQTDEHDDFENALVHHDTLYKDSSDDEVEEVNKSPERNGKGPVKEQNGVRSYHDDSDDDMLG
ncbi:sortilin-like [Biomphalaria glabrata]|uniref:Sortilin-like n=1 Tax=Biomphalaria glabrata TaxID=6526 RepID=A0A9W3A989_BIOGL|nr:sortilin-like [Biomphalaria glabrata]